MHSYTSFFSWESGHFHLGQFQDECFKSLPQSDTANRYFPPRLLEFPVEEFIRGLKMNLYTVRSFAKAIKLGSKYVYQTVPRLLTIWLDLGEDPQSAGSEVFQRLNDVVAKAIKDVPPYKVNNSSSLSLPPLTSIVVYGLPTNCLSCGPHQPRCL